MKWGVFPQGPAKWIYVPEDGRCYWDNEIGHSRDTIWHWPERPMWWWQP